MRARFTVLILALTLGGCAASPPPVAQAPVVQPPPVAAPLTAKPALLGWDPPCQPSRGEPRPDDPIVSVVQPAATRLIERIRSEPGYGGAWFENEPCYRVVLAFTDGRPRWSVIEAAEAWLRPYIGFARSRFTEAERNSAGAAIRTALGAAGIKYAFSDTGGAEEFGVYVGSQADIERARQLVPQSYLAITRFHLGIPVVTRQRR